MRSIHLFVVLAACMVFYAVFRLGPELADPVSEESIVGAVVAEAAGVHSQAIEESAGRGSYSVQIRRPEGPPVIDLATADATGSVPQVACSTCHSVREPDFENQTAATLDQFHQGFEVNHGNVACYGCHNPSDMNALKTADGSRVEFRDVMKLCSQCHAAQALAFQHGAHGGMNGYWDLTRGPQLKNNCIDCHDPHAPKYPNMIVGFRPRDRFLEGEDAHDQHP